jgi:hypothetical protein
MKNWKPKTKVILKPIPQSEFHHRLARISELLYHSWSRGGCASQAGLPSQSEYSPESDVSSDQSSLRNPEAIV